MNTPDQQLSESLLAACKAAGINNPKYITQDAAPASEVWHWRDVPNMGGGIYTSGKGGGTRLNHPPYAADWQDSLLEWVDPCINYIEDKSICDSYGEPKGQCLNCGAKDYEHKQGEPLADVLARHQDHVADGSKMIPSGIEALVCADIAKRQQVGIAKYGKTLANNPMTLIEGLVHAYEESLDFPIYLKNNIVRLAPEFEAMQAENERAKWIMRQLINDLPRHRDWLNPDIEREMKAMAEKGGSSE